MTQALTPKFEHGGGGLRCGRQHSHPGVLEGVPVVGDELEAVHQFLPTRVGFSCVQELGEWLNATDA